MQTDFNSTAVPGDFDVITIHKEVKASLKEYPPFWHSDFVWVRSLDSADIIEGLKNSQFADYIDEKIYYWPENLKYFATDKGFVFSAGIYEANIANKRDSRYTYNELLDSDPLEIWEELKSTGEYFATYQIKLLKSRSPQLAVIPSVAEYLKQKGFTIKMTPYKDKDGKEYHTHSVVINKDIVVKWCISGKKPDVTKMNKGRKGKVFALEKAGRVFSFKNKKECFEKMFAGVCGERTFKNVTKDKVAGDLITIKGETYKICEIF